MTNDRSDSGSQSAEITRLLSAARAGDPAAFGVVFDRAYAELRRIAHRAVGTVSPSETINTTAVVHEAYLKLVQARGIDWEDRAHFFAIAATAMRQIVVDYARRMSTAKRGSGTPVFALEESGAGVPFAVDLRIDEILALDGALTSLAEIDARLARVVELRFFAGLSVEETASLLQVGDRTVKRDWRRARAFLLRSIRHDASLPGGAG